MKFEKNGHRITGVHKTLHAQDEVVVRLESRHPGLSDNSVSIALDMTHNDRVEELHHLLHQLESILK